MAFEKGSAEKETHFRKLHLEEFRQAGFRSKSKERRGNLWAAVVKVCCGSGHSLERWL